MGVGITLGWRPDLSLPININQKRMRALPAWVKFGDSRAAPALTWASEALRPFQPCCAGPGPVHRGAQFVSQPSPSEV